MKLRFATLAVVLCALGFGCEMHRVTEEGNPGDDKHPKTPTEMQRALEPEPANPHPPSFFPTPQPE